MYIGLDILASSSIRYTILICASENSGIGMLWCVFIRKLWYRHVMVCVHQKTLVSAYGVCVCASENSVYIGMVCVHQKTLVSAYGVCVHQKTLVLAWYYYGVCVHQKTLVSAYYGVCTSENSGIGMVCVHQKIRVSAWCVCVHHKTLVSAYGVCASESSGIGKVLMLTFYSLQFQVYLELSIHKRMWLELGQPPLFH